MEDVRKAIMTANENFMAAFKRGDAAAVAALYTKDAKVLPPNNPMLSGTEAIQAFWQGAMGMGVKDAQLETVAVDTRDDLAYEVGRYTLTIAPQGQSSMTDNGKYVVVWKKQDGAWKLHVDIWNSNMPT